VNTRLNGYETDFHWPQAKLVVEVDGWEYHEERAQFEEDRRRGLDHRAAGWEVIRVSAWQVFSEQGRVAAAVRSALVP
jgi:very-short-patch-repair endonuclease